MTQITFIHSSFIAAAIVLLLNALFTGTILHAQTPPEPDDVMPGQPIMIQAEKLVGNATPNGFVRELTGNVVLTQNAVTVKCDRAIHYLEQNRADVFGNVVLTQGSITMKTPQGSYDGNARRISGTQGVILQDRNTTLTARDGVYSTAFKIARFFKQVNIENDSLIIYCDTLEYHRLTQNSYATGNASVVGKFTSAFLQGDSLVNIPQQRYTRISNYAGNGQPMVSQIDTVDSDKPASPARNSSKSATSKTEAPQKKQSNTAQNRADQQNISASKTSTPLSLVSDATTATLKEKRLDTLCITGNLLEAFRYDSNEVYKATGDVQITRYQLAGRANVGLYEKTFNRIRLLGTSSATVATLNTPVLWLDSTQLRSDSIIVNIRQKRLEKISAFGGAFAATKSDTAFQERIDQLTGENIVIAFARDTLRSVIAEGKAFNLYFTYSDEQPDGAARNAADTIKILFENSSPSDIYWLGKVEGEYYPEFLVKNKLASLNLRGFLWRNDKPRLQRFDPQTDTKPIAQHNTKQSIKNVTKPTTQKNVSKQSIGTSSTQQSIPK